MEALSQKSIFISQRYLEGWLVSGWGSPGIQHSLTFMCNLAHFTCRGIAAFHSLQVTCSYFMVSIIGMFPHPLLPSEVTESLNVNLTHPSKTTQISEFQEFQNDDFSLSHLPLLWAFITLAGLANYSLFSYGQQTKNVFHIFKGLWFFFLFF